MKKRFWRMIGRVARYVAFALLDVEHWAERRVIRAPRA